MASQRRQERLSMPARTTTDAQEQNALPPLGLLQPLAKGEFDPSMSGVLPMTDAALAKSEEELL
jgi:hypothetical protein